MHVYGRVPVPAQAAASGCLGRRAHARCIDEEGRHGDLPLQSHVVW